MADINLARLITTLFVDDSKSTPALRAAQAETKKLDAETRTLIQALDDATASSKAWGSSQQATIAYLNQVAQTFGKTSAAAVISEEADRRYAVTLEREAAAAAKAAEQAAKMAEAERGAAEGLRMATEAATAAAQATTVAGAQNAAASAAVGASQAQQAASLRNLTPAQQMAQQATQQLAQAQASLRTQVQAATAAQQQQAAQQAAMGNLFRQGAQLALGFSSAYMAINLAMREGKELIKGSIDNMFELATATRKLMVDTGMTAEQSSALLGAFKQYGISGDQAASGLGRLGRGLQGVVNAELDGRNGAIEFRDAMRNLGIESTDAAGRARPHLEVLLDIADAFKKTTDEAVINQASMALLNRNVGYQLAPFLKQGRDGVLLMMEAQKQWGNVLNDDTYPAIVRVMMQTKSLQSQTDGLRLSLAKDLLPTISNLTTALSLWELGMRGVNAQNREALTGEAGLKKEIEDMGASWEVTLGAIADANQRVFGRNALKTLLLPWANIAELLNPFDQKTREDLNKNVGADLYAKAKERIDAYYKALDDAKAGQAGGGALPFNEDEITKVTRQLDDFLSNEVAQVNKSLDDIKDARDKSADDIIEKQRSLSISLQGLTRTEVRAQIEDYVNYTQLRMKLADDIAEKERSLKLELAKLDDTELKAERDNAEKRLDVWHSYNDAISKLEESHKFAHEDYLASIVKANRSAQDTQNKLDSDWADKQHDYEDQRVKARADSLKKIEDLEKQHNSKIADLQRGLFNLRSTGPETADTLNARRMAAEKLLAAMQDKTKAVTDAKEQAAGELAPKLKSIDDQEAKEKRKYEADKALAARKAADDLAEIERNNKQQDLKFESDKRRAKESADYSISNLAREAGERFADYKKSIQLATDQANHEIQQAKIKANEQIVEMQRVATKRYEDYLYNWNKDTDQANHEIELNRIAMEDKITKIRLAHDEYMAKQDIEKTRFIEDNKVILAEIEKRRLALNALPNVNGGSTSDARAAALNALNAAEGADSIARSTATLDGAAKLFKENVEKDGAAKDEFNKHMDLALKASQGVPTTAKENAFLGTIGQMNFYLPYDMSVVPKWFEDFIASMSSKGDADIGGYGRMGQ